MPAVPRTRSGAPAALLAVGLAGGLASSASAAQPRPNIVLVVVDDLRWDDIGAAGHPFARTPHIDRLARCCLSRKFLT